MSSSVFLSNVDDYFAPSQACVNPLFSGSSSKNGEEQDDKKKEKEKQTSNVVIPRQHRVRQRRPQQQQKQQQQQQLPPGVLVTNGGSARSTVSESPTISINAVVTKKNDTTMNINANTNNMNDTMDPVVKASIADCLACSGCVTTAETVLLEEKHSLDLLRQRFIITPNHSESVSSNDRGDYTRSNDNDHVSRRAMIMTISPASWADLARHLDLQPSTLSSNKHNSSNNHHHHDQHYRHRQWTTLLDQTFAGLALVLDGNVPLQWSLLQAAKEFCQAKEVRQCNNNNNSHNSTTSTSTSSNKQDAETSKSSLSSSSLISSSCPAVVCLVEKSIHQAVPHLSTTKSPMSMAGAYLRQQQYYYARSSSSTLIIDHQQQQKESALPFFLVAVMPCHDKKLEASRSSSAAAAAVAATTTTTTTSNAEMRSVPPPDTDLVITTSECLQLLQEAQALRDHASFCWPDNDNDANTGLCKALLSCPPAPCITTNSTNEDEDEYDDAQSFLSRLDATVAASLNSTKKTSATLITVASSPCGSSDDAMDQTPSSTISSSSSSSPFVHGSGGYADFIFRYACRELYGFHLGQDTNPWKPVEITGSAASSSSSASAVSGRIARKSVRVAASQQRNRQRDYYQAILYKHRVTGECSLEIPSNENDKNDYDPVLKFAIAYGMQTLQRVLKPFHEASDTEQHQQKDAFYDYIEAMACPSGCLNGGGQLPLAAAAAAATTSRNLIKTAGGNATTSTAFIAARETPTQTRQRVQMTQSHFLLPPSLDSTTQPGSLSSSSALSSAILSRIPMSQRHVTYHAVAPLQLSMGAAAGVAVKDIQW